MRTHFVRTLVPVAFAFAAGALTHALADRPARAAAPEEQSPHFVVGQLGRVLVEVENSYVDVVDRRRLLEGAIKGMVAELDPHSSYMTREEYAAFNADTVGQFGGVGLEVDLRGDAITVIAPIEGSPAARAGIASGDKVIAVDGHPAFGVPLDKLVRNLRGAPGTRVKLGVRREGVREPLSFDLTREIVHVASVSGKRLDGDIAYLRIKQFQEHTHAELITTLGRVRSESTRPLVGVVLDLRSNPGGLVDQASAVADEFLGSGTIYTTRHRGQRIDDVQARSGGALVDLPIVALVNAYSASASELLGGALQDQRRALIVGERTFGKGSVQSILDLPGGEGMRLTTARYYTPAGRAIQAAGLTPDVTVEANAKETAVLVVREGDLEGALGAESAPSDAGAPVVRIEGDAGVDETMNVATVPRDPSRGGDVVLRVGYTKLRDSLVGRGPIVR